MAVQVLNAGFDRLWENNNKGVSSPADESLITSHMCTRHDDKRPPVVRSSFIFHAQPCGAGHFWGRWVMHHGACVQWDCAAGLLSAAVLHTVLSGRFSRQGGVDTTSNASFLCGKMTLTLRCALGSVKAPLHWPW